ncbi:MAG: TonB-dependent receptor [Gemmatimonadetes bacterium]|nr:TonB-dependent receptor [Gemmatimonadota bacterium]
MAWILAAFAVIPGGSISAQSQDRDSVASPADSAELFVLEPLLVRGRLDDLSGSVASASVGFIGRDDLRVRPLSREGELLETVPGMILTQHSGGGKSNQMFVRGFNLDHGTDFSTRVEGMPLNIASHAHGQGYTDINFLVPELVEHVEYSLGNYYAHVGDFGSAGEAHLRLRRSIERPFLSVGIGEDGHQRIVAGGSSSLAGSGTLTVGGELRRYDGPWALPEDLSKVSTMARYTREEDGSLFSVLAMAYTNSWQATDQIPRRRVEDGTLDRFGNIDPTLGGTSSRYSLSTSWSRATPARSLHVDAYAVRYGLDLFSNFTYLLDDPTAGDQIRQEDDGRWTLGANASSTHALLGLGRQHDATLGFQLRGDWARVRLSRTWERSLVRAIREDDVRQLSAGVYGELETEWKSWVRSNIGLRADAYSYRVTSDLVENSGSATDALLSPKLSLVLGPWAGAELYLGAGLGFHSNDARGVVATLDPATGRSTSPVDPLVQSRGGELGLRASPVSGLRTTMALWALDLDSELVYVGDAGSTEPSDGSRRMGLTLANFYRLTPSLSADLDVSLARARFLDVPSDAERIPGALERVVAAGMSHEPTDGGLFMGVRIRHFGAYPLTEDNGIRAKANTLVNLNTGLVLGSARLTLSVLNVFDEEHSDIQYFYRSRLAGEPVDGVGDVHFHPAEPRQVRLGVTWEF